MTDKSKGGRPPAVFDIVTAALRVFHQNWSYQKAADAAGVSKSTLMAKLKGWNAEGPFLPADPPKQEEPIMTLEPQPETIAETTAELTAPVTIEPIPAPPPPEMMKGLGALGAVPIDPDAALKRAIIARVTQDVMRRMAPPPIVESPLKTTPPTAPRAAQLITVKAKPEAPAADIPPTVEPAILLDDMRTDLPMRTPEQIRELLKYETPEQTQRRIQNDQARYLRQRMGFTDTNPQTAISLRGKEALGGTAVWTKR